jgi:hypothetical protein
MRKVILAAMMLVVAASSQSYAALVTVIGSATVEQGSSGGFFNVPITVSSNSGPQSVGAYLVDFSATGPGPAANRFRVFSETVANATLFNTPGLVGTGGFFNDVNSTFYSSNGTTASLSILSATPDSFSVNAPGTLAFLPVSTNLAPGVYTLVGSALGIQDGIGNEIGLPITSGTFTVTAVPEPSTIALLAVVGLSGVAARRFRSRKKVTTV